jgi:PAS domain S-box-containing protein
VLGSAQQIQTDLSNQLEEVEARLGLANAGVEFWKGQSRKAEERARLAEASRLELVGRMDQLAIREKQLAREQEELSRAKDRLEKHVEARTVQLHRLQQRYMSILNSAGEGICSFDLEGRISFVNPAVCAMMGWSGEELLGMSERDVFADHGARTTQVDPQAEPEPSSHPAPVMFRRKDMTRFPVEFVRTPVEENGRQVGTVLIFKDVTERTEADMRFSAKVSELARSNSELEQFAFVASHDLQEPLRKIQAFGDRLKTRLGTAIAPEATDYLSRMQSAAARMQGLIDGLLMYSRVLTRAQPFSKVELNTVVREVIEDLEVRIEKSRASVEVGDLPAIEADALQIRQLIQNLVGNALKFQVPGNPPKVSITARIVPVDQVLEKPKGETEFRSRSEMCEVTVQDNGIGFDESYLGRLFVVFQRLHSRSEYEGTGIGLAVCRKIVTRHGGTITARSTPGQGARFIVVLPLRQNPGKGETA